MYQTDQITAVASLPSPAVAATQGYFTNGNPGSGLAATVVDADFLNMTMMEIINVVNAAGLVPSKTTYNQLLTAIRILIQSGGSNYGLDTGTVNSYRVSFAAAVLAVADGMRLTFKAAHTNTGNSTFSPNPGVIAPAPIWGGNLAVLVGGEILTNGYIDVKWNSSFGAWVLLASTGGAQQVAAGSYGVSPPANDRSKKLVTAEWVQRNYKIGEVKMWHGALANIAAVWGPGWQLADGSNGTANLKDRFIVGAGNLYGVNAAGGSNTVSLAIAHMPAHNHVINIGDPGHAHAVYDPGHNHGISQSPHGHGVSDPTHAHGAYVSDPGHAHGIQNLGSAQAGTDNGGAPVSAATGSGTGRQPSPTFAAGTGIGVGTYAAYTGVGIQAQYANVSNQAAITGIGIYGAGTGIFANSNNTGSGAAFSIVPLYYALCFIEYTGIGA
ncbi:hypothetical protein B0G84_5751 [Paraburkholderia sp. BL8N3]|nr:hypothetical protein [Paraburkholderia sp. BL8N3]TCK36738.1 hypothetical protein B0G84_5751 [Paraburkholderia sp. BL8N3]